MNRTRIIVSTVILTLSALNWGLAALSAAAVHDRVWSLIGSLYEGLRACKIAGQGHCALCGMSHAFRALWMGDATLALSYNAHSVWFFGLMLVGCLGGPLWYWLVLSTTRTPVKRAAQLQSLRKETQDAKH